MNYVGQDTDMIITLPLSHLYKKATIPTLWVWKLNEHGRKDRNIFKKLVI